MKLIDGRYQMQTLIGKGGMGTVHRGLDNLTGEMVAIKSPLLSMVDLDMLDRFRREAEALRRLEHPNIVRVHDAIEDDGEFHIVMEYVDGGDLSELIGFGRIPLTNIIQMGLDIADALTRTHRLEIVHRDLKPSNVLLTRDNQVKLTDFGIAHFGSKHDENITDPNEMMGTVSYMAPEVLRGLPVDSRADIWGFGMLLFEMLMGQLPFSGPDAVQTIQNILYRPLPDVEEIDPNVPTELSDLLSRMLHKDRNSRVQLVRQVGYELEMALGHFMDTNPLNPVKPSVFRQAVRLPLASPSKPTLVGMDELGDMETVLKVAPMSTMLGGGPGHLPMLSEAFIGREDEIESLIGLIKNPNVRLITLLAPGGMGKSRLAIEVGARIEKRRDHDGSLAFDRVVYVNLEAVTDGAGIVEALAVAVGYSFTLDTDLAPDDASGRLERLIAYIQQTHLLIILDRFEHLLEYAPLVGRVLDNTGHVNLLVTSRERLNVGGEQLYPLSGMKIEVHNFEDNPAVQLFIQSARRVQPAFDARPEWHEPIRQICKLLDGTPLGIVLAASWIEYAGVQEIADDLNDDIGMLTTNRVDILERQRSMVAVVESSWQRLAPDLQEKMLSFSVFRGDFTRAAAQEMSQANLMDLRTLVDRAIMVRDPVEGNFTIHEIIRQYAEKQARDRGIYDSLRQKHARYYLRLLYLGERDLLGRSQRQMIRKIENDLENIAAGWQAAVEYREVILLHGALDSLYWFAFLRGQWQIINGLFEMAAQAARDHSLHPDWQLLGARLVSRVYDMQSIDMTALTDSVDAVRAHGDTRQTLSTLLTVGRVYKRRKQQNDAVALFGEVVELASEPEYAFFKALALSELAMCQLDRGETADGIDSMNRSIQIQQESGDEIGLSDSLRRLGYLYWMQGGYDDARKRMDQALSYQRVLGSPQSIAMSLAALANMELLAADFDAVTTRTEEAIATATTYKNNRVRGWATIIQGNMANAQGDTQRAISLCRMGIKLVGPTVDLVYDGYWGLAIALYATGDLDSARKYNQLALTYAVQVKSPAYMALYLPVTAAILLADGDAEGSLTVLSVALNHPVAPVALLHELPFVADVEATLKETFGDGFGARWEAAALQSIDVLASQYVKATAT